MSQFFDKVEPGKAKWSTISIPPPSTVYWTTSFLTQSFSCSHSLCLLNARCLPPLTGSSNKLPCRGLQAVCGGSVQCHTSSAYFNSVTLTALNLDFLVLSPTNFLPCLNKTSTPASAQLQPPTRHYCTKVRLKTVGAKVHPLSKAISHSDSVAPTLTSASMPS